MNLVEFLSHENAPNPFAGGDGGGTLHSLAEGAHKSEEPEKQRRSAFEEPVFRDQHASNPTRFLCISKHEVVRTGAVRRQANKI